MSPLEHERGLRARAAATPGVDDWRALDVPALAGIAQREGIDFAAALLFDRLARSTETRAMLQAVEETDSSPLHRTRGRGAGVEGAEAAGNSVARPPHPNPSLPEYRGRGAIRTASDSEAQPAIVIVPGAGYREYPETGAGGERIRRLFPHSTRIIPTASFGASPANAQTIIDWLLACSERDLILVSLSKGSADLRLAFEHARAAEAFSRVRAWISLSGIPFGTPLAGWILQRPIQRWAVKLLCWCRGLPFDLLGTLDRDAEAELTPSPHLGVYHVVGFPLREHLSSRLARRCQRRLAALGPSDGGGFLLGDVTRLPGVVLPVWGADHYLRPVERFDPLIARLLTLAARDTAPCPVPMR